MGRLRDLGWDSGPMSGGVRRGIIIAAAAAALFGGGTLLGVNLQSSNHNAIQPATASSGIGPGASSSPASSSTTIRGSGPKGARVFCADLTGSLSGTLTIAGCSQPDVTGGSGTLPGLSLGASGPVTVTWNGTGTTTFVYSMTKQASKRNKCPSGQTESVLSGSVTANNPLDTGHAGVRGPVHAKLCIDASSGLSLLAGQTFKL